MLQQIRVRRYVYSVASSELPSIGAKPGQTDEQEAKRLHTAFAILVQKPLPRRPGVPLPFPVRESVSAPSALAIRLDRDHLKMVAKAWRELISVVDDGAVFKASKSGSKSRRAATSKACGAAASKTKAAKAPLAAPRAKAARTPTAAQRALEGEEFEEDDIDWKVLMPPRRGLCGITTCARGRCCWPH